MAEKQHVFLVGAKSLGAYGGYETFIDKMTEGKIMINLSAIVVNTVTISNHSSCLKTL